MANNPSLADKMHRELAILEALSSLIPRDSGSLSLTVYPDATWVMSLELHGAPNVASRTEASTMFAASKLYNPLQLPSVAWAEEAASIINRLNQELVSFGFR